MLPIEQACYWLATLQRASPVALEGDREADIAIIGAGLTGLWTALFLKDLEPGRPIVIVEQGIAAYGGSGRNAGIISETVDHGHQLAVDHFGEREARVLVQLGRENLVEMIAFLEEHGIDCELERVGRLMVALTPGHVDECRMAVEAAHRLGVEDFTLLDATQTRAELDSPLYLGAVSVPTGGILNPAKLVDGLRREALRQGIAVYEESPVTALENAGAAVRLRTPRGAVTARRAILATSAYSHRLLPGLTRWFMPLYDYILVSEPLTPEQRATIGWRRRQGVTDLRAFFNYYRLTRDGRILWGTSEAAYYGRNRVGPDYDHSPKHYAALRESFRRTFPALATVEFPYAWGGPICSTTRLTPFFGSAKGGRILYGLGYTGHGLGSTRIVGRILAHLALERPSDLLQLSLVRRKPFPFPPEPFRGLAVNAVSRALRRVDAGQKPSLLLKVLSRLGIGFSS